VTELPRSTSGLSAEDIARQCADKASRIIMDRFAFLAGGRREATEAKGRGNFVTESDLAVEAAVLEILRAEYADHSVLSEETAREVDARSGWCWIVDPIDGTHNFSQGIPHFCFTIALCNEGEPVLGLTRNPATGDEFFATQGGGFFVNGERAMVSATASLDQSIVGVDLGYDDERAARLLDVLREIWPGMQALRVMGSAALGFAYAACGRFDVFTQHRLWPWDCAAGILFLRETGGLVVQPNGSEGTVLSERLVGGAPGPVRDLLRVLRERV
jgi:fructose-1,6-bisphosphatase/inositol monophosphatase family enzyme